MLSTLRHPRIIRLYGVQQVQDRMLCFIMEYARGGSLKTYMDNQVGGGSPEPARWEAAGRLALGGAWNGLRQAEG